MKASEEIYHMYAKAKAEGNCKEYIEEMCVQLEMFGTESNTLTKQMVHDEMEKVLNKIKKSLEV